ncbi:MAG: type II toxin-antitoxin system RelE/ParE family toxin [Flavobacteriaceae bacterium]|nr:type II toxin-antitoxin system RelE/ParE family toxin [Flavobacteriaceae bacterium]
MYRIIWTHKAREMYKQTLVFWNKHNQSNNYSQKISVEMQKTLQRIARYEKIGEIVSAEGIQVRRIFVLRKFAVYYRIRQNYIEIIAFLSTSQQPIY